MLLYHPNIVSQPKRNLLPSRPLVLRLRDGNFDNGAAVSLDLKQRERIKSPNPSKPMNTQRESRRTVSPFTTMVAKFLHIPDRAAVWVIWAAGIAVVIIIGIIVMLWR
jgi:hypothetical protein